MRDLDPSQYGEGDRREVDPPAEVRSATWSAGGTLCCIALPATSWPRHQPYQAKPRSSARLKTLPCEVERVVELVRRCVSNPFKLHAGMEFIRAVTFG